MSGGWLKVAALTALLVALDACDSSSSTAGIDRGGVRSPIVTQGPITGFGSIVVNGVHYDLGSATITVNGALAAESALALGQLVTIVGEREVDGNAGAAQSVSFEANVRGPVDSVDAAAGELVVLGQRIVTSATTVLSLGVGGAASVQPGDLVEASGFAGAGGLVEATLISRVPAGSRLRVYGTIEHTEPSDLRFEVSGLVVDYSAAVVIEGFPTGGPRSGDLVIVEGSARGDAGELLAETLEAVAAEPAGQPGRTAEIEGLITRFVSAADFSVAGLAASARADTDYEGGSASSLMLNVKVKVVGEVDASGVIVASKIEVKDGGRVVADD